MYTFKQAAFSLSREKLQEAPKATQEQPREAALTLPPPLPSRVSVDRFQADNMTLSELEKGDKVVRIHSELFREDVLLVPDNYIPRPEDPVCYTAQEARLLLMTGKDEDLRTIHETKKLSRGHVIYAAREVS